MTNDELIIDKMITIDDDGMPKPPSLRQLIDKDVRQLYSRDKSRNKEMYIKECIIIYYLYDPKSPAQQSGLNDKEALKMGIEQAGLPNNYIPDNLVRNIGKRYYEQNITEAGKVVENITKGIHNINLFISLSNQLLSEKISNPSTINIDDIGGLMKLVDNITEKASELPDVMEKLNKAKEALLYEKQSETVRGGVNFTSSMDASNY